MTSSNRKFTEEEAIGKFFSHVPIVSPQLTSEEMATLISRKEVVRSKARLDNIPLSVRVIHLDKDGRMIVPLLEF